MTDILWLTFEWPILVFIIAAALCVVIVLKVGKALGGLLLALLLYNAMAWNPWWEWVPQLFWLAWLAGLAGIIWGLCNGGGRMVAIWGAGVALVIGLALINSNVLNASPPLDKDKPGITGRLNQMDEENNRQNERLEELESYLPGK